MVLMMIMTAKTSVMKLTKTNLNNHQPSIKSKRIKNQSPRLPLKLSEVRATQAANASASTSLKVESYSAVAKRTN